MSWIEELMPEVGRVDADGLRKVGADTLAKYVVDAEEPWWRRKACVRALEGRVPEGCVADLMACVADMGDRSGVRESVLELLGDRAELLPLLRHEDRRRERQFGMGAAVLKARGRLGDRSAAGELATLAAEPWARPREAGEAGLDGLVDAHGVATILDDLGDARPEDRRFGVRMRHRAGHDVTYALADPDRGVAHLAASLVDDAERLRRYLREAPTVEAKLWAAYGLHRLTGDDDETRLIYRELGSPRVEVAGLDDELRAAIVHRYAARCQPRSDPRWRVEALCAEPPRWPDEGEQLARVVAALAAAELSPGDPRSCGEVHQQGGGTYHVIKLGESEAEREERHAGQILVSTLGRFFSAWFERRDEVRQALEPAGFRYIDEATGAIRVTDLCVYYFGDREPLDVSTLLFYWQD